MDRYGAHIVASHPEQGWSLLCNGVVLFDDGGALLPDGHSEEPHAARFGLPGQHRAPALLQAA
jgi:hypothetical protein